MKKWILCAAMAAAACGAGAEEALWLRDVKISPDGSEIAFAYKGDIYAVATAGGTARRLTSLPSYESNPVWSPDGRSIAFASDRHGNFDVFVMPAAGGVPRRLTTDSAAETPEGFTPEGSAVLYSAAIQAPAESAMFPSARMTQLYSVDTATGVSRQVLGTPAQMVAFSPDGQTMLYQDLKGFEDEWRKHHTSSVTRDIWAYTPADGRHRNLTDRPGEDRNPVFSPDGNTIYILSERNGGTMNVWALDAENPASARPVTDFATHPVRFLSQAANGTMAFTYDGEIYTLQPGGSPKKITVDVVADTGEADAVRRQAVHPAGAVVSPDGKSVAFLSRGVVFVTSVEYPTTLQVTHTPASERHLAWGADSRTLYYTSERSGHKNIYRAEMERKADPNFPNATAVKETPMFAVAQGPLTHPADEYSHPLISPDGKKMAFVKNRNNLMVMDLATNATRQLTAGETYPGRDDEMVAVWSPDSRWLAIELIPPMRDPYSDIGLVDTETGEVTNLTNSGYFCRNPRFVLDGNALLFFTDRYGLRAHASWGSQDDVMILFLNREAHDRFNLSEEDYALLKDSEKNKDKEPAADSPKTGKKKADKPDKADKADKVKPITVELDGLERRMVRLTPYSSDLADATLSADGETLYYLSAFDEGYDLWKMPLRKKEPKLAQKTNLKGQPSLQADSDGKALFILGAKMQKLDPKADKLTPISATANQTVDPAAERRAMFDYVAVEEAARFYHPDMHGVDWPAMTEAYRRFLPHITNNYDFAELLSELLGELNVSHTGGRYRPAGSDASATRTASLGLLYDLTYTGPGRRVAQVIANGPFDKAASAMAPGATVTAVNSQEITPHTDLALLLDNLAGKKTLVAFTTPDGQTHREVVIPATKAAISDLLYDRWVAARAADVERWSGGRLGYVHIPSMADASFRPMYADLLGKYANADGVVIDIRWNGGGRMHEDIEVLFSGQKYLTQEIRGTDVCDMPSRRWNKPSIMLIAEPCYSNAHGTPWVYSHQGIGKTVGMPVPGTMTSVNWVTMQDPTMVFGIPVIGYRTAEGSYLENSQLEPDIRVANSPETIVKGEDSQLRAAVEALLRQIDND